MSAWNLSFVFVCLTSFIFGCEIFEFDKEDNFSNSDSSSLTIYPASLDEDTEAFLQAHLPPKILELRKFVPKPKKQPSSFEERYYLSRTYEDEPSILSDPLSIYVNLYQDLIADYKLSKKPMPVFIQLESDTEKWAETISTYFKPILVFYQDEALDMIFKNFLKSILAPEKIKNLKPEKLSQKMEDIFRQLITAGGPDKAVDILTVNLN